MKYKTAVVVVLILFASRCSAQESGGIAGVFDEISVGQTIEQRKTILEGLDFETLARRQFKDGPKYMTIAGIGLITPGADHRRIGRDSMIIAPFTGCVPPAHTSIEKHGQWSAVVSNYALRWNLLMRHFESEQHAEFKPSISLSDIQSHFRIQDDAFSSLSLESKLLMQYTVMQLIAERERLLEIEDQLDELGILALPFPEQDR